MIYIILGIIVVILGLIAYGLENEKKVVEKAEKSNNMFNFYHVLATMTSSKYRNYKETDEEKLAMADYLAENSNKVHDEHPIGSYFKLCEENDDVCNTNGNFDGDKVDYNPTELGIGAAVLAGFFIFLIVMVL